MSGEWSCGTSGVPVFECGEREVEAGARVPFCTLGEASAVLGHVGSRDLTWGTATGPRGVAQGTTIATCGFTWGRTVGLCHCAKSLWGEAPCGSAVYGKVDEMSSAP